MTIRRRLFWSNILMIAVPACLTALMGLLCMGMVWLVMQSGSGLGMEHSAEFYHMGEIAAETVASAVETGEENLSGRLEGLTSLLDGVARTPAMQQKYLQTIREKTKDIDRLVSQLFLFSELDLESYPLLMRPLELSAWLPKMVEEVREDYRRQGLEVRVRTVPALVRADPEQLRRVLVNLLDNSAKYKERPEGTVEISVTAGEREVLLQVADDGPGVPEEALPKLFDAFYRSDPARKNPAGGSGLGLAIAAKAVENMGGSIRAYNVPAGGLTIAITLPREAEGNAENPDY